jgi:hypothetical protein
MNMTNTAARTRQSNETNVYSVIIRITQLEVVLNQLQNK